MKISNVFSAKSGAAAPTVEQLRLAVPSIYAERPADNVSERYGFVSTSRIIDIMQEDGYQVVHARGGVRNCSREFGVHEVRLRRVDEKVKLHETFPEIVLLNSHNGTSSTILHMGLFRQVCANGLVVGDSAQTSFRVPHLGDPRENVISAAHFLMSSAPRLNDTINNWRERKLSVAEIKEFGRRASELRKVPGVALLGNDAFAQVHRDEDAADNLWNVFNRTQENLVRGGVALVNENTGRVRKTRALRAVKPLIALNRSLWDLAEEFLPN
jgi:hypothetical protein